MAGGKAVCGAVKADVEHSFTVVDNFADLFFIGDLGDQSPGLQFFVHSHVYHPFQK